MEAVTPQGIKITGGITVPIPKALPAKLWQGEIAKPVFAGAVPGGAELEFEAPGSMAAASRVFGDTLAQQGWKRTSENEMQNSVATWYESANGAYAWVFVTRGRQGGSRVAVQYTEAAAAQPHNPPGQTP